MYIPFVKLEDKIISTKEITCISKGECSCGYTLNIDFSSGKIETVHFCTEEKRDEAFKYLCDILCKAIVPYPPVEVRKKF